MKSSTTTWGCGKLARAGKTRGGSALSFCTILYGLSVIDDVTDTPFSNAANGYPDAPLVPDESTRIELPWRPGTDAVIAELIGADGRPLELSPRAVLGSLNQGYAELGLQPVLGFEYEMWLFVESPVPRGGRRPAGLRSLRPHRERLQPHPWQ